MWGIITQEMMGLFFVGDSIEILWYSRGSFSPRGSFRRGENGSWLTHSNK